MPATTTTTTIMLTEMTLTTSFCRGAALHDRSLAEPVEQ